ncbi:MAG: hypothetical protein J7513_05010 [Solirubrobacteraceae bacterium]|nr:hypothetical protein [Solirubrobacteraceae bacterium]
MKNHLRLLAFTAAASALLPATAIAAPVTVTLRIEGPTSTIFEGPVTTDVRTFKFAADNPSSAAVDESQPQVCDGTAANGGTSTSPVPTAGAAVAAALEGGLAATGTWFGGFGPGFDSVGSTDVTYDVATGRYLAEYEDWDYGTAGICAQPVKDGSQVLLAYASGSEQLLKLAVDPATLKPGQTGTATVTDGMTDTAVAGAIVDGRTTGADGKVQIGPFTSTGPRILKAEKPGAIRSNGGQVCVTDGADGACGTVKPIAAPNVTQSATISSTGCQSFGDDGRCGTPDDMPPLVRLGNVTSKTYTRATAPRELKGQAGNFKNGTDFIADPSGIKDVKLRITRYFGSKCWTFDGESEKFTALKGSCGTGKGKFFSVGNKAGWSYLLPAKLKAGKYRIEAFAVDGKGNSDKVRRWNKNHVVFRVK